jgi:integrase
MARRMNGEGYLRRRPDGRWELRVMLGYRDDGKPNFKHFYGKTKKEVQEKLHAFQEDLRGGIDLSVRYTFDEWSEIWYDHHKSNITPTTQENYRHILNRMKPYFSGRYIIEIKPFDIENFLKYQRAQGLSDSYISSFRGMLYQIFHKAEANDLVRKNPVRFADKMRSNGPRQRKEAFTAEEVRLLMTQLPKDKMGISIRLMLGTGMRSQELLALEPRHIEEDGSVIHIRQAVNLVKGSVHVGVPKSRDSYRDIPVPPNLRWCAKELRNVDTKYIWEKRKKDTPCNPSNFRDEFKEAIGKIEGVRILTPHSCRHTYVSQMQALGVDLSTIQSIVGHADVDMTEHYLHVQDGIRQEAIRKFANAFPVDGQEPDDPETNKGRIIQFRSVV